MNVPQIVDAYFGRTGEIAASLMPSGLSFFNENIEPYRYDPAESERLLEEAGIAGGFDTTLWYIPIPRPYVPDGKGIAQAAQSDQHKVGINAELVTYEFATYLEKVGMGEHDMALYGGTESGTDPDFRLYYWFSSDAATEANVSNISYYKNPEVDRLIAQARSTLDQKERRDLYYRVQEIVHEDVAVLPLAYVNDPVGLQKGVKGCQTTLGGDRFNTVKFSGGA